MASDDKQLSGHSFDACGKLVDEFVQGVNGYLRYEPYVCWMNKFTVKFI